MAYNHLSLQERHYIEVERKKGTLQKEIAASLRRSASTLSHESFYLGDALWQKRQGVISSCYENISTSY